MSFLVICFCNLLECLLPCCNNIRQELIQKTFHFPVYLFYMTAMSWWNLSGVSLHPNLKRKIQKSAEGMQFWWHVATTNFCRIWLLRLRFLISFLICYYQESLLQTWMKPKFFCLNCLIYGSFKFFTFSIAFICGSMKPSSQSFGTSWLDLPKLISILRTCP